jgi:integrase
MKLQIATYDKLVLPATLDGSEGTNKTYTNNQLNTNLDIEAVKIWLSRVQDSPQTYRSYRKEIERLILWSVVTISKPLSSINAQDISNYLIFIADPQPAQYWCGGKKQPRSSKKWRPFNQGLSLASQKQTMTILNTAFNFFVDAGYLINNPFKLINKKGYQQITANNKNKVERFLEKDLWENLWDYIAKLPQDTPSKKAEYERTRFLFSFLYLQAPRVNEVATHKMNSFSIFKSKWWWHVTGKGNKQARIPVPPDMLVALRRYRKFLGLTPLPSVDENIPLLPHLHDTDQAISADMIYKIVKKVFQQAANEIAITAPSDAAKLRHASTHWIRHTAITHQADSGLDIRYIQANARHSSIETTKRYLHKEEDEWHNISAKHKLLK